jgi:hypothetical protein
MTSRHPDNRSVTQAAKLLANCRARPVVDTRQLDIFYDTFAPFAPSPSHLPPARPRRQVHRRRPRRNVRTYARRVDRGWAMGRLDGRRAKPKGAGRKNRG